MRALCMLALLASACVAQCAQHTAAYTTAATEAAEQGPGFVVHVVLEDEQLPEYGPSFKELDVAVTPESHSRLHVKISPSGVKRWEVPESVIKRPGPTPELDGRHVNRNLLYSVQQPFDAPGNPFSLRVIRKPTNEPIFDTSGHRFVFKDQYIELTTAVPEDADLYGLGETTLRSGLLLPRDGSIITLYNRDLPAAVPNANLYGSHPFVLQVNKDGSAHGVFLLNSNGMDVVLNKTSMTYKVIGGLVDLYFFLGPSPEAVIRQYHEVIGAPAMPPYWALGSHQGRWGYKDVSVLEEVVANYKQAGIPLEGLWLDIEYMANRFQTLTLDENRFAAPKMRAFVDALHSGGRRWVPIHDAAIAKRDGYKVYEDGTRDNVWLKDASGAAYVGQVWPGEAVYPDYLAAANVSSWIKEQLQALYDQVPFDGLWLDMNEASNFCTGSNCRKPEAHEEAKLFWLEADTPANYDLSSLIHPRTTCQMTCDKEPEDDRLAYPPYKIHNFYWDEQGNEVRNLPLSTKVVSPTAQHADGTREYDAHNLYGTTMAMRSNPAATEVIGKRPFFLLRSTFPGAGKWAGHWTGDNGANWESLRDSVPSILAPNMWGIAMVGADICGFVDMADYNGNGRDMDPPKYRLSDDEYHQLCNRWTSAGAFYPFVRNHYTYDSRNHEPYRWPDVAAAARKAYGMRYRLLTYLYSTMHLVHSHGGTLARPLFFTDPTDKAARRVQGQWMLGEALLISPVLERDSTQVEAHFTTGTWYSLWDFSRIDIAPGAPKTRTLQVPMGDVPLHIRGGTIVPMQQPGAVTRDVRLSPVTLVVALPPRPTRGGMDVDLGPLSPHALDEACGSAHLHNVGRLVSCGYLFMDSGEDVAITPDNSLQVWFSAVAAPGGGSGTITSSVKSAGGDAASKLMIEAVTILGVPNSNASKSPKLSIRGQPSMTVNGQPAAATIDAATGALQLTGLKLRAGEPLEISWTV